MGIIIITKQKHTIELRQNQTPTMLACKTTSTHICTTLESFNPNCLTNNEAKVTHKHKQIPKINFPVRSLSCGKNEYNKNVNMKHIILTDKLMG